MRSNVANATTRYGGMFRPTVRPALAYVRARRGGLRVAPVLGKRDIAAAVAGRSGGGADGRRRGLEKFHQDVRHESHQEILDVCSSAPGMVPREGTPIPLDPWGVTADMPAGLKSPIPRSG
jgi:hypothetical protein